MQRTPELISMLTSLESEVGRKITDNELHKIYATNTDEELLSEIHIIRQSKGMHVTDCSECKHVGYHSSK